MPRDDSTLALCWWLFLAAFLLALVFSLGEQEAGEPRMFTPATAPAEPVETKVGT